MNINDAIEMLKQLRAIGTTDVLIPRDFCPAGDFTFEYIAVPPEAPQIVWIKEIEDEYTQMRDRALEQSINKPKVVMGEGLQTFGENARPCEACNNPLKDHEWVVMDYNGFVDVCSFSIHE